jgi:hypothetical protein
MIEFLIWVVILCIIFGLIYYIVSLMPLPPPFKNIAMIVILVVFLLILLFSLLGTVPMPKFR